MTPATIPGLERLGVALLIGFLIGIDRERAEARKSNPEFAGVRTFPLIAFMGCAAALLAAQFGLGLLIAAFLAFAAVVGLFYHHKAREGHTGATTEISALVTFLLGITAGQGELVIAASGGVVVAILLAAKARLEKFSQAITAAELRSALELGVVSVIVLPLLPDEGYGPWNVLNPHEIWMVVVLVSALSFAAFVAIRLWGESRGLALTGAIGGLISSTGLTLAMAEQSRTHQAAAGGAVTGAILASSVMAVRVGILAGFINTGILPRLVPFLLVMALTGAVAAWLTGWKALKASGQASPSRNPVGLWAAVSFGLVYGLVLLGVRAAQEYLGNEGSYAAAAISGLADVDAATIAFARLGPGESGWRTPAAAVMVAITVNTLVKIGLGMVRGNREFRYKLLASLGAMAAMGVGAGVVIYCI